MATIRTTKSGKTEIINDAKKKIKRRHIPLPHPSFMRFSESPSSESYDRMEKLYHRQNRALLENKKYTRQKKGIARRYKIHSSIKTLELHYLS